MKERVEFDQFYQETLKPQLRALDEVRKTKIKTIGKIILGIVGPFILAYFISKGLSIAGNFSVLLFLLALIMAIYFGFKFIKKYRRNKYTETFKKQIIAPIVHFISDDLQYYPKREIPRSDYKKSRLFLENTDRYEGEDFVEGQIDKTLIHFSELHTQYKSTNSKGETRWHTIFRGLFFVGDFNKDFKGSTVLLPNHMGSGFSFFKKLWGSNRKEKLVELADPEFMDNYTCYSTDDIQARYILSPALMKRLNDFHKKYPNNEVCLSFVDGQIFVAITYNKDLFEPSFFSSVVNKKKVLSYFDDIKLTVEIVEDLNLNTRIWTKS